MSIYFPDPSPGYMTSGFGAGTISVNSFTEMKLRSHWPSVTPSAGVLVRFPLQVILSVEAALASTIMPKASEQMQRIVRRSAITRPKSPMVATEAYRDIEPSARAGVNSVCRTWHVK